VRQDHGKCGSLVFVALGAMLAATPCATAALYANYGLWEQAVGLPVTSIDFSEPPPQTPNLDNWYAEGWGVRFSAFQGSIPRPIWRTTWQQSPGYDEGVLLAVAEHPGSLMTVWVRFDTPILGIASTLCLDTWVEAFSADMTPVSPKYAVGELVVGKWGVVFDAPATWVKFKRWDIAHHMFGDLHWAHVPAPSTLAILLPTLRRSRRRASA
jgi:hypothetical protein